MVQTQISSTPAIGTVKNRLQFKVPSEKKSYIRRILHSTQCVTWYRCSYVRLNKISRFESMYEILKP